MTRLREKINGPIRLGTGEFGDSLALEAVFPVQREIIRHAARLPEMTVEVKTKSDRIEPLRHDPERDFT